MFFNVVQIRSGNLKSSSCLNTFWKLVVQLLSSYVLESRRLVAVRICSRKFWSSCYPETFQKVVGQLLSGYVLESWCFNIFQLFSGDVLEGCALQFFLTVLRIVLERCGLCTFIPDTSMQTKLKLKRLLFEKTLLVIIMAAIKKMVFAHYACFIKPDSQVAQSS